ncbi:MULTISPECIES: hypothetical protein [unclassified Nonomuraea]|uniref:hypothetical protein n=1 Tax=unclassified Nonomuraea TaxID=2593643 RepID=UPI0033C63CAB
MALHVSPSAWRTFHLVMTAVWATLLIPTMIWWRDSVLWVAVMSIWANVVGHWSAYQAARAEENGNG